MTNFEIQRLVKEIENDACSLGGTGDFPAVLQIIVIGSIGFIPLYFLAIFITTDVLKLTEGIWKLTVPTVVYIYGCSIATFIMKRSYKKAITNRYATDSQSRECKSEE
ncbi:MAG: hypothetical protein QG574_1735 [Cyanobacteriota bacterium erpe_2018_sw_21hr_WHONDRS-SW48-000092_B_bin.40]|jgi:hypothetical protein|nr:hypothetical protein [Cyanobacteriota bacterium erpe_2018_sw_21hr_WHONDRS-SW48-000092_B_bin.40]